MATAELLQRRLDLLLLDIVVLLVLRAARQALPGELTLDEVEQYMPNRLQVIPSRLLDALVRRDRRVPGRTSQIFAVFVRDVLALAVLIALGETEVNDVDAVTSSVSASDQEIVRLDIAMDDPLFMHLLDSLY